MKLIRRKSDYLAVYLFEDSDIVTLTDRGLTSPIKVLDVNPTTFEVIKDVPAPAGGFKPSRQTYFDGEWSDA